MAEILARLVMRRAAQQQHENVIAAALIGHPDRMIVRPLAMLVDHGQLQKNHDRTRPNARDPERATRNV